VAATNGVVKLIIKNKLILGDVDCSPVCLFFNAFFKRLDGVDGLDDVLLVTEQVGYLG